MIAMKGLELNSDMAFSVVHWLGLPLGGLWTRCLLPDQCRSLSELSRRSQQPGWTALAWPAKTFLCFGIRGFRARTMEVKVQQILSRKLGRKSRGKTQRKAVIRPSRCSTTMFDRRKLTHDINHLSSWTTNRKGKKEHRSDRDVWSFTIDINLIHGIVDTNWGKTMDPLRFQ